MNQLNTEEQFIKVYYFIKIFYVAMYLLKYKDIKIAMGILTVG